MSVWFWYPGLTENRTVESPPVDLTDPDNDRNLSLSTPRATLILPNPDFTTDITKPPVVIVRRSMSDTIRTYVKRERTGFSVYTLSLAFDKLNSERARAVEHFVLSARGKYIGYKSVDDRYHAGFIQPEDVEITAYGPRRGYSIEQEAEVKDTAYKITLALYLFRHEEGL